MLIFQNNDWASQRTHKKFSPSEISLTYILFIQSIFFLIVQAKEMVYKFRGKWLELFSGQFLTRKLVELL